MIYLFGSGSYKDQGKYVKVGYTGNREERELAYLLHNPLGEFLGWREGDKDLETKLHLRLGQYKAPLLEEWFYDEPEVLEVFGQSEGDIDRWLWDNRGEIFYPVPKEGRKKKIYNSLKNRYGGSPIEETRFL
jgi:hypothetical protein